MTSLPFDINFIFTIESNSPTDTIFARQVDLKTLVAGAFVCPQHVLTHAVLADFRVEGTLVNI